MCSERYRSKATSNIVTLIILVNNQLQRVHPSIKGDISVSIPLPYLKKTKKREINWKKKSADVLTK